LINFVNFAARQVFVPLIRSCATISHVTDAQLGSLQAFLLVVLAVAAFLLASWPTVQRKHYRYRHRALERRDVRRRPGITFLFFLIARSFVGLGEPPTPRAQSHDFGGFPQERRAAAQAIFAPACCRRRCRPRSRPHHWSAIRLQVALFIVAVAGIFPV